MEWFGTSELDNFFFFGINYNDEKIKTMISVSLILDYNVTFVAALCYC